MPTLLERILAKVGLAHAGATYRRFRRSLSRTTEMQERALASALRIVRGSDLARSFGLERIRTVAEFRRAVPLLTYEDLRPQVERVMNGEVSAMFALGTRILMFATSSGTTSRQKFIPVTREFADVYRKGWNTFGVKMITDHPRAILRGILQSSGRFDESFSPSGVPCGAITGLMARFQKGVVRRFYVGSPELAYIDNPAGRYYALARLGAARDVAFAITANPSTLIRIAETAAQQSEALIRDVRDGTISAEFVPEPRVQAALAPRLAPDPGRAAELERLRASAGILAPRDFWRLEFLACWTGGSMGHYLPTVREWYGNLPIRDIGLLASEGRVSLPLDDGSPAGVLDIGSALFEFADVEAPLGPASPTYLASELAAGRSYSVILTGLNGLLRYRLDDVIRVCGNLDGSPIVEFLYRRGGVSSIAGEKLTENQLVAAVAEVAARLKITILEFLAAPQMSNPPHYRLTGCWEGSGIDLKEIAAHLDQALCDQNAEYDSRRKSSRLSILQVRTALRSSFRDMDERAQRTRRGAAEQYKRSHLLIEPGSDSAALMID